MFVRWAHEVSEVDLNKSIIGPVIIHKISLRIANERSCSLKKMHKFEYF